VIDGSTYVGFNLRHLAEYLRRGKAHRKTSYTANHNPDINASSKTRYNELTVLAAKDRLQFIVLYYFVSFFSPEFLIKKPVLNRSHEIVSKTRGIKITKLLIMSSSGISSSGESLCLLPERWSRPKDISKQPCILVVIIFVLFLLFATLYLHYVKIY